MDANLQHSLESRDNIKKKRNTVLASKEGKAAKSRLKYDKYNKAQQEYLSQHKSGLAYGSGIALAVAKKKVKNSPSSSDRNPAGTTKSML